MEVHCDAETEQSLGGADFNLTSRQILEVQL